MRITKMFLVGICFLMIAPAVWSQTASQAQRGILGYLDPRTGAFRPLPSATDDAAAIEPASLTTFGGTITVTLTITVKSTGITNVLCTADTSVTDAITTGGRFYTETVSAPATGTGASRTCKLTIPYAWALATQASDTMSTSYSVVSTGTTAGVPVRSSSLTPLDSRKVPANGAVIALTAAVTL